jgi:predicted DNA-binding protein
MKMQNNKVRASISFPVEIYETLEGLAKQKKVSLAWVVRDAAERYIADGTAESRAEARTGRHASARSGATRR